MRAVYLAFRALLRQRRPMPPHTTAFTAAISGFRSFFWESNTRGMVRYCMP